MCGVRTVYFVVRIAIAAGERRRFLVLDEISILCGLTRPFLVDRVGRSVV